MLIHYVKFVIQLGVIKFNEEFLKQQILIFMRTNESFKTEITEIKEKSRKFEQITELNYSKMCRIVEAIAINISDSDTHRIKNFKIGEINFNVRDWLKNELVGYKKNNTVPYYRHILQITRDRKMKAIITTSIPKIETTIRGMALRNTIRYTTSFNEEPVPIKVKDIILSLEGLRSELVRYVSRIIRKVGGGISEAETGTEVPEELLEFYGSEGKPVGGVP